MSWALGFDDRWKRWIGYGVPAYCDHPGCNKEIDRGLAYVCAHEEPYGGDDGCGLYFCEEHRGNDDRCERCEAQQPPFEPKREHPKWLRHMLRHRSWQEWRHLNPEKVAEIRKELERK